MKGILFAIILVFSSQSAADADTKSRDLVEIPKEFAFASCIIQSDAPIIIEELQLLTDSSASFPTVRYEVKNRSRKEIVFFAIDFHHRSTIPKWNPYADTWIEATGKPDSKTVLLKSGEGYENMKKIQARPETFSKELPDVFRLSGGNPKLLSMWIGYVTRVVFKDGTEYNSPNYDDELSEMLLK